MTKSNATQISSVADFYKITRQKLSTEDLSISLVLYRSNQKLVRRLLQTLNGIGISESVFIEDHSLKPSLSTICQRYKVNYAHNPSNPGFGAGHNKILRKNLNKSRYQLILNPDIEFKPNALIQMIRYLDKHPEIALAMPTVINPDDTPQYLTRKHPRPLRLIARRLFGIQDTAPTSTIHPTEIPFLSGCFMLIRSSALKEVGLFDERFFLYFEDADLCRRLSKVGKCMHVPLATVKHHYAGGSRKNKKLFFYHLISYFKYFNKHGWLPFW